MIKVSNKEMTKTATYTSSSSQTFISEFPPPTAIELERLNWAREKKKILEQLKDLDDYDAYRKILEDIEKRDFEMKEKELDYIMEQKMERFQCMTKEKFELREHLANKRIEALKEKLLTTRASSPHNAVPSITDNLKITERKTVDYPSSKCSISSLYSAKSLKKSNKI